MPLKVDPVKSGREISEIETRILSFIWEKLSNSHKTYMKDVFFLTGDGQEHIMGA